MRRVAHTTRSVSRPPRCRYPRRGYTRRDVAVAAMVVAILLALAGPALLQMRGMSRRQQCEQRIAAWSEALRECDSLEGRFPGYRNLQAIDSRGSRQAASWVFPAFPYFGDKTKGPSPYQELYEAFGPSGPAATRGKAPRGRIEDLLCPDDLAFKRRELAPWLSYVANCGMPDAKAGGEFPPDWPANGVFLDLLDPSPMDQAVTRQFLEDHDGAEATLLLSENIDARHWTDTSEAQIGFVWIDSLVNNQPARDERLLGINELVGKGDGSLRFARPASGHVGGVNAAFCSGATRPLSAKIDYLVFVRMMTPADQQARRPGSDEPVNAAYR